MPKKDIFHNTVRIALEKDGWEVTHDPLYFEWEDATYYPDLGAEKVIAASKGIEKIAVEIKTFLGQVSQQEFYEALGQFDNYAIALSDVEPERKLVLAIPIAAYETFFQRQFVKRIIEVKKISLLIYNTDNQTITQWINHQDIDK
jgi:hypothetical protein